MACADIKVDSQVLEQLYRAELGELRDINRRLKQCGVGKLLYVSRIVVVGERSSGKSAVLEAISHIRFPVNNGGYSKLAIEVLFQPATETSVQVTLQYFDSKQNRSVMTQDAFNQNDLSNIIQTAIESIDSLIVDKAFLNGGTCKVEIKGPNVQHPLTLVDLPDFRADTESGFSTKKPIFNSIIPDYIGNRNSVVLAVMPADQKLASNQAKLSKVEKIDPTGERTITVITKPDLLNAGSMAEAEYVRLVKDQNKAQKSHLGWHALCNTTSIGGSTLEARDTVEEEFFGSGAWASVPKSKVGICSLRKRICQAMYSRLQHGLPRVIAAAEEKLRQRECELSKLGAPRSEIEQVRQFLTKVAIDFQFLARDAIQGRYDDVFFGGRQDDQYKLRAQLKTFHRAFQYTLKTRGSSRIVRSKIFMLEEQPPGYLKDFFDEYSCNFPCPITINESILEAELNRQADKYQSSEHMAIGLFREQAKPWRGISQSHIERVTSLVKAFVDAVFVHLLGSPDDVETTKTILTTFVDPWFEKKERLLQEKLAELLKPYDEGHAALLDIEFDAAFSNISAKRVANRMFNPVNLKFQGLAESASTEGQSMRTQKVIDLMSACYETARKTFAATVITLAVENCLVTDIPEIFTPMMVAKMTDEQLNELSQESEDVRDERESLNLDIDTLRHALNICKKHKPRAVSVLPTRTPLLESDLILSPKNPNGSPGVPCQSTPQKPQPKVRRELKPVEENRPYVVKLKGKPGSAYEGKIIPVRLPPNAAYHRPDSSASSSSSNIEISSTSSEDRDESAPTASAQTTNDDTNPSPNSLVQEEPSSGSRNGATVKDQTTPNLTSTTKNIASDTSNETNDETANKETTPSTPLFVTISHEDESDEKSSDKRLKTTANTDSSASTPIRSSKSAVSSPVSTGIHTTTTSFSFVVPTAATDYEANSPLSKPTKAGDIGKADSPEVMKQETRPSPGPTATKIGTRLFGASTSSIPMITTTLFGASPATTLTSHEDLSAVPSTTDAKTTESSGLFGTKSGQTMAEKETTLNFGGTGQSDSPFSVSKYTASNGASGDFAQVSGKSAELPSRRVLTNSRLSLKSKSSREEDPKNPFCFSFSGSQDASNDE
ncbi:unnamed protein product [Clonostachys rhizophaga]|uniref:Interferon-induced GTP-binding protein Mx n=1 Tax=Clonostachys rhizophaga TaxID=160324 RepID=A0A9N9VIH0_9HYPO|nr:unnamed protein product [Clonostachys rhizophaga]